MIIYRKGKDIVKSSADVSADPVNCVGVSGAGLAAQIARTFPRAEARYREAARRRRVRPGYVLLASQNGEHTLTATAESAVCGKRKESAKHPLIAFVPTKRHWRDESRLEDVREGVQALGHGAKVSHRTRGGPLRIALPKLGCGLGGLPWLTVLDTILACLRYAHDDQWEIHIEAVGARSKAGR